MATRATIPTKQAACCIALISRNTGVDLNAVAHTVLYTVPVGYKLVLFAALIRELSADALIAAVTVGQAGAETDFLAAQTIGTNLEAAGDCGILQPIPHATTAKGKEYAEDIDIEIAVTVAAGGACTCTVDLLGILIPV